eukprot:652423-Hanusia_phi.AAC.1
MLLLFLCQCSHSRRRVSSSPATRGRSQPSAPPRRRRAGSERGRDARAHAAAGRRPSSRRRRSGEDGGVERGRAGGERSRRTRSREMIGIQIIVEEGGGELFLQLLQAEKISVKVKIRGGAGQG